MVMKLMRLVTRLVNVDDDEDDGVGGEVGGVNTSVQCAD